MFSRRPLLTLCAFVGLATSAFATIINVPGEQPTIQAGIDAAVDGDTVLVAPNIYYENINFREKGIVVASHFILNNYFPYIESTVINGGAPSHPDTASCVLIVSDSATTTTDTSAALIGFTLTGGLGTKWQDEHGAGLYREGGGILIQYLSPIIKYNIIKDNHVTNTLGVISTGGGAIRCGDGNPLIINNVIVSNSALYGGGIVLNYTSAIIRNNIIAYDSADGAYGGGGGIWAYQNGIATKIIENNTIVYNSPGSSGGGGLRLWRANTALRNNIIWGNAHQQIYRTIGSVTVNYCDVQGGWSGEGNIDADPLFSMTNFYLSETSPCIDAGDTSEIYNDPEDILIPGYAEWPSMGTIRNDMGAYGGPDRQILPDVPTVVSESPNNNITNCCLSMQNYPNPFNGATTIQYSFSRAEHVILKVYNVLGEETRTLVDRVMPQGKHSIVWDGKDGRGEKVSSGVYIYRLEVGSEVLIRKMTFLK